MGDRVASPRHLPVEPTEFNRDDEEVALLSYMIAEGGCTAGTPTFSNVDPEVIEHFLECANKMGFHVTERPQWQRYSLRGSQTWMKSMGIWMHKATEKRIPGWVFRLPERQKWIFLGAFVDTDGWIAREAGQLGITLANEGLIDDLAQLFIQVGVPTVKWYKANDHAGAWSICVDQGALAKCGERMPLRLKGDRLQALLSVNRYSLLDTYPPEVARDLPRGMNRRIRNETGLRVGTPYAITRPKMKKMIEAEWHEPWVELENDCVLWDSIVSIEEAGEHLTYDIEVEGAHNFVGNLLITHNSTSAEMAVAALAARGVRRYGLYICETQEQADDHISNVAALLRSPTIELAYPDLGKPAVTPEGHSKGWRRSRIVTASGFILDACGLDSAARGIKFEDQRPDFMLFDDIDGELDGEAITEKKIKVITRKLLPAGSPDCGILMVQNLVHENSIFARLADGRADFLRDRHVSGPIPAVKDLEVEEHDGRWVIVNGEPTWPEGFGIAECQKLINEFGLTAFLAECQHKNKPPDGEIFSHINFDSDAFRVEFEECPPFKRVVVWVDPAVTSNESSDSMGIQCDALGIDGKIYRLWSWEQRSTPYQAMKRAIKTAILYKADTVGVETNQGGDTWRIVYDQAMEDVKIEMEEEGDSDFFRRMPRYKERKATKDLGSKVTRAERMLVDYERDVFRHVRGTHETLESALKRFPRVKPFDLVDAACWSWAELAGPLHRRKSKLRGSARRTLRSRFG